MMKKIQSCAFRAYGRADAFMTRHRMVFGAMLALLLAGVLALYNVSSGPLRNLNDIGGWSNRAAFIGCSAIMHALALVLCTALSSCCFARIALRQMILTAGYYILLLGINHKTYAFSEVMLPLIRTIQQGGIAAALGMNSGYSVYALQMLESLSSTAIYPMYMLKLTAMTSLLVISILTMRAAEKHGMGVRAEALLALCVILPQGFMNAACSALIDVSAVALLFGGLALMDSQRDFARYMALALVGMACALSGVCLYALPLVAFLMHRRRENLTALLIVPVMMAFTALPAVLGGVPVGEALASFLKSNFSAAPYAAGSPGLMSLVPRALVEEMPQYASILSHFEALDTVTHAQQYYTQAHFLQMSAGFVFAGLAAYAGVAMLALRARENRTALTCAMIFALGALMACPGATSGAWLALDMLCLYAVVAEPKRRLPACMVLFATMTSSVYPMTEETMLPMIDAFALCLCALLMLLDVIPMSREEAAQ